MKRLIIAVFIIISIVYSLFASENYDAEYLEKSIVYRLNKDGSSVKEIHTRVKLNTYKATSRTFGESFILYNRRYQKLEVLLSETIMKDGKRVKSPKNAFNEVLPRFAKNYPAYSHLREMVVSHIGLERGAVIDFKYRIYTDADFNNYFSGFEYLSDSYPIKKLEIKIIVPSGKVLKFNCSKKFFKTEKIGENTVYSLLKNSVKNHIYEPKDGGVGREFVIFSDAENWSVVFPKNFANEKIPEFIINSAIKIKNSSLSKLEKLFNIQKLIVSDIALCRVNNELTGKRVRGLKEIIQSNYARKIEKAYLLSLLLKKAGIENDILIAFDKFKFYKNVYGIFNLNGYFIKINNYCNEPVFIDPVHLQKGTIPQNIYANALLNISSGKVEILKQPNYKKNMIDIKGEITFGLKGYSGKLLVNLSGIYFNYRASLKDKKRYLMRSLKSLLGIEKIIKMKLIKYSENLINTEITVEGKILKSIDKKYSILKDFNFKLIDRGDPFLKERNNPLIYKSANGMSIALKIRYPKEYKVDYLIKNTMIDNETGKYICRATKKKGNLILLNYIRILKKNIIEPSEYKDFKTIGDNTLIKKDFIVFIK